ncbi:MAG: hypothetical protein GVY19_04650 [Bacteroidetes bacterium]|nr:hypothetical protein [Bacteroidota bacterium]
MHSLIGKNDGVSIVIDQTVNAMVEDIGIELGSIFFLAAHTSPRFNAETDDIFWHKNEIHNLILSIFSDNTPPDDLDQQIHEKALYAKDKIAKWVKKNRIDLIIAHNTSHPYNFITAVGLGYYIEELRAEGIIWPKLLVWWHDSYFEREKFKNPNPIVDKYLRYLPGTFIDGIAFINKVQPAIASKYFHKYDPKIKNNFFESRAIVVPNTSSIEWEWKNKIWDSQMPIAPEQDNYNDTFLRDIGLICEIEKRGFTLDDTVLLLQHTRVVPRKKIELAIDLAFYLEDRFLKDGKKKCMAIIVSGHSGDEQEDYKKFLNEYFELRMREYPEANVIIIFGEKYILSHRDIIVDRKYYKFAEIPSIIASHGGLGTYFSEVEGYGNNLLEMIAYGLPSVINKYEVYKTDIEELGFDIPAIEEGMLTMELVEQAYLLLTDYNYRNKVVKHNLEVLDKKLGHKIIAEKLEPLIYKMFTRILK